MNSDYRIEYWTMVYWNESTHTEKITLSLEEIRSIKDVKVELSFEPGVGEGD